MWWFDEGSGEWRFYVSTPYYDAKGPKKTYAKIQSILKRSDLSERLPITRVVAVSPKSPMMSLLCKGPINLFGDGKFPRNIMLQNIGIDRAFISGAYVYRVPRR